MKHSNQWYKYLWWTNYSVFQVF